MGTTSSDHCPFPITLQNDVFPLAWNPRQRWDRRASRQRPTCKPTMDISAVLEKKSDPIHPKNDEKKAMSVRLRPAGGAAHRPIASSSAHVKDAKDYLGEARRGLAKTIHNYWKPIRAMASVRCDIQ